jgi:hypothetical protein
MTSTLYPDVDMVDMVQATDDTTCKSVLTRHDEHGYARSSVNVPLFLPVFSTIQKDLLWQLDFTCSSPAPPDKDCFTPRRDLLGGCIGVTTMQHHSIRRKRFRSKAENCPRYVPREDGSSRWLHFCLHWLLVPAVCQGYNNTK